jgi:hypothetical protein
LPRLLGKVADEHIDTPLFLALGISD